MTGSESVPEVVEEKAHGLIGRVLGHGLIVYAYSLLGQLTAWLGLACLLIWSAFGQVAALVFVGLVAAGSAVALTKWTDDANGVAASVVRGWYRSATKFRPLWSTAMRRCGGVKSTHPLPILLRARATRHVTKLLVKLRIGQTPTDFDDKAAARIADAFGALAVRNYRANVKRRLLTLWVLNSDPLLEIVPPYPPEADPLPRRGLRIAKQEDGNPFRVRTKGAAHLLIGGDSDSGKSGVEAAIVDALHPAIMARKAQVWGVDMKDGVEFAMYQHLFYRWAYRDLYSVARMLEDLVAEMKRRNRTLFGFARQHTPSTDQPLILLLIDELLDLLSRNERDRHVVRRIEEALKALLRKGRSASIWVVASTVDARKAALRFRDLWQYGVGLRMRLDAQADMILGKGARAAGALCDKILPEHPGVAYVSANPARAADDDQASANLLRRLWAWLTRNRTPLRGIVRVRFCYVDDARLASLAPAPDKSPINDNRMPQPSSDDDDEPGYQSESATPPGVAITGADSRFL